MIYDVYGNDKNPYSPLLLCSGMWVVNGAWELGVRDNGTYYCVHTDQDLDIKHLGTVNSRGDYNQALDKFIKERKRKKKND